MGHDMRFLQTLGTGGIVIMYMNNYVHSSSPVWVEETKGHSDPSNHRPLIPLKVCLRHKHLSILT